MFSRVKVTNGKREAVKFKLNAFERKVILNEVCHSQNYFPRISAEQDFRIKENDTVIDIGAHVGIFSVYAANLARNGRVYSFEPVKKNFKRLEYHRRINNLNNITAVCKGVSDKNKNVTIFLCKKNSGGNSMYKRKFSCMNETAGSPEIITCITLKSIFDEYRIKRCNFLKMDCEGEEYKILKSLPNRYFKKIEKISLEFHHPIVNELRLAKHIANRGFRVTIRDVGRPLGMIFAKRIMK
ncbi:MAG: hypothetical protein A2934_04085 [Candidatus Sungbacteria bacterium RIFCSPLOWO2_01_FULL_47_10]|uniref:Methyltransferase FkbM domain-containing protein n=1 Tax=Candidatus Sungbacteria bacterium RIFCSPLOWO2_01_FULL_47_10 TaxID=1802276 RepID=A0A1G2KZW3_9BACT|nr:MAG: hypothetical protein A2934_04085 [Candidatus Sungbacteria bacterium RIFCSPLOWO2_01_FULL_47_10]